MRFSAFTPLGGGLRFSGAPPRAQLVFDQMKASLGGDKVFDFSADTHLGARLYALAKAIARAGGVLERAHNQAKPLTCVEMLPSLERDYRMTPKASDGIVDRQRAVQSRREAARGAGHYRIVEGLRSIAGANFLAYRPLTLAEAGAFPDDPFDTGSTLVHAADVRIPAKTVKLTDPITGIGLGGDIEARYTNLDPTAEDVYLAVNDVIMVEPGSGRQEKTFVSGVFGTGETRAFTANCTNPHDIGGIVTTANWPYQFNHTRYSIIVLVSASARDPETRRKIDDFMTRTTRGVSQWAIVEPTSPGALTVGPLVVGDPMGVHTIDSIAFALTP